MTVMLNKGNEKRKQESRNDKALNESTGPRGKHNIVLYHILLMSYLHEKDYKDTN